MLEFFAHKKHKKNKEEPKDEGSKEQPEEPTLAESSKTAPRKSFGDVVLDESDQEFIERVLAQANEIAPPLPPRCKTPDISWDSSDESAVATSVSANEKNEKEMEKGKSKAGESKKKNRFSFILNRKKASNNLEPAAAVTEKEADKEIDDLTKVLNNLNLAAKNNKAISLSDETSELVGKFTIVFKDLMNGVPTAYDDLLALINDHDGVLSRNYEKLPGSLKKLITTLPTKLTSTLAPELLAVAAEAQGLSNPDGSAGKEELKEATWKILNPANLGQLLTKPGAIASMLKGIVNALKTRFPAFIGTNVLWAVAVSILIFVVWYCHKRGREVRLEREISEKGIAKIDEKDRVEVLPDDPALPATSEAPALSDTPATPASPAGPSVTVTEPNGK